MSIETDNDSMTDEQNNVGKAITVIIHPKEHDLGGFIVRRALPSRPLQMVGPWIFFDHIGPASFPPGKGVDVRPHPHINLATVTYLIEGEMYHRDSLGNALPICPGEINLMVAGKGIVHSERQRAEVKTENNHLHGLQLWMALPEVDEEIEPEFHHYDADEIPTFTVDGVNVRTLIGSAYNKTSPVKTFAATLYVEATVKSGQSLVVPDTVEERALYVTSGEITIGKTRLNKYSMAALKTNTTISVTAIEDSRIAIIGGEKMSRRYIWWNFVSSRKDRIEQARRDWQSGAFKKVPGDENEFIPLPNSTGD